jgi:hypothetical protein
MLYVPSCTRKYFVEHGRLVVVLGVDDVLDVLGGEHVAHGRRFVDRAQGLLQVLVHGVDFCQLLLEGGGFFW